MLDEQGFFIDGKKNLILVNVKEDEKEPAGPER